MANNLTFLNGLVNTVLEAESFSYFRNAISASYGNFTSYTYVQESGSWFVCSEISPDFILTYRITKGTAEETTFLAETGSVNQFVPRKRILQSTVSETDEKVKVTSNDTTTDYLFNKLVAGPNITLTETDDGSDEKITITASFNESADVDSLNGLQGTLTLDSGPNINITAGGTSIAVSASVTTVNTFSGAVSVNAGPNIVINNSAGILSISGTDPGNHTTVNEFSGSVVLVAGPNITINSGSGQIAISSSADLDEKVKVSSNDTTSDYLFNKLVAGPQINLTEANDGGDEKVVISGTFVESSDVDSLNGLQGVLTLNAGPNVTIASGGTSIALTASATKVNEFSGSVTLVAGPNINIVSGSGQITISGTVNDTDEKVKVSSNDTTTDYLFNKLVAGPNITLTETDDAGNEKITITASFNESTDVDSLNGQTGVVNIVAGPNVNVGADNGNVAVSASVTAVNTFSGTVTLTAGDDINIVSSNGNVAISSTFVESADVDSVNTLQGALTIDAGPNVVVNSGGTSVALTASVTTLNAVSGTVTLTAGPNITVNTVGQDISITGSASGVDEKVKVSSNDTTEDYLFNKLVAGPKIVLTEANDGSNEKIVISSSFFGPFSGSKSGFLSSSFFFGSPRSGTVIFETPYVDNNYSVVVQGENSSADSSVTRVFTVASKTSASFVAKMGSSRMKDFLGISWQTIPSGEGD